MAGAILIDGRAIAAGLRQRVAAGVALLRDRHGVSPGIATFEHRLPANAGLVAILDLVAQLNRDERVDGILVQLPLPDGIDPRRVIAALDPAKDIDGFHPVNVGRLWG